MKVKAKVALGIMCGNIEIHGKLYSIGFGGPGTFQKYPSGYLGMPTNNGSHHRSFFSVIPELNLDIGYQVTEIIKVQIGYTFLYASNVMRAGNQIDRTINTSQAPAITGTSSISVVGPARPKELLKTSGFWAQGLNLGVIFQY